MTSLTEVRERPIPFTKAMIEAILAGRKSQTRRAMRVQPESAWMDWLININLKGDNRYWVNGEPTMHINTNKEFDEEKGECPYGKVGDRLWVKSRRFMPKRETQIWLEITDIRVERLRSITEQDAIAEGIPPIPEEFAKALGVESDSNYAKRFSIVWDSINNKRPGCSWQDNPFVWVISFKRIEVSK